MMGQLKELIHSVELVRVLERVVLLTLEVVVVVQE